MKNSKVNLYKIHHDQHKGYGNSLTDTRVEEIAELINRTSSKTLLDFGCGKGIRYKDKSVEKKFGIMPTLYDPAIEKFNTLPSTNFDGIFSTDVMEHIPEDEIDEILSYKFEHANKFVYIGICVIPAVTHLSTGENAHCTVKPFDWWLEKIKSHNPKMLVRLKCYEGKRGKQWVETLND